MHSGRRQEQRKAAGKDLSKPRHTFKRSRAVCVGVERPRRDGEMGGNSNTYRSLLSFHLHTHTHTLLHTHPHIIDLLACCCCPCPQRGHRKRSPGHCCQWCGTRRRACYNLEPPPTPSLSHPLSPQQPQADIVGVAACLAWLTASTAWAIN